MASPTVSVTSQSVGVPDNTPITNPVTLPEEPRSGQNYIDTYDPLKEHDERDWQDSPDEDEDDIYDEYDENRVEDEDWEVAEKDFTKQYNRLRQHVAVHTGNAQSYASTINHATSVAALPAVNHPRTRIAISTFHPKTKDRTTDQMSALAKYTSRIAKIDTPYVIGVSVNRKGPSAHANAKDKSDRATNEQVLDPRTRLILFKMIGRDLIHEVNGCVSTGKEANVYHALTSEGMHLALKIYKTSILVFKDRDKYVTGEYRFRRGYSRNPRKMVRLWAEKEMRNLKRLTAAGIRCPDALEVRENVLVMTFVGSAEGWASPRLKDAELPADALADLYAELVCIMRRVFHVCKLVHADLSEYNILYHESHLWVIDVSQSVEQDHPAAFDFLRNDIKNAEDFFGRLGVKCLGLRRCFDFVTREKLVESGGEQQMSDEEVLKKWISDTVDYDSIHEDMAEHQSSIASETAADRAAHEDSVFLRSFIPRTLNDVFDPERDTEKFSRGEGQGLIYADTIGLLGAIPSQQKETAEDTKPINDLQHEAEDIESSDEQSAASGEEGDEVGDKGEQEDNKDAFVERQRRGHRYEDKDAKKERKKATKAETKEKRKHKMPKSEKKRIVNKTRS